MDWYALFVETGNEEMVQALIYKFFDQSLIQAIVPKRKLKERRQGKFYEVCRTMFPGYVFVHTVLNVDTYYELKNIPRCYRLLNKFNFIDESTGKHVFHKIDDEEMVYIIDLISKNGEIDYSNVYVENAKVIVRDGPLKGREGIIKKIDKRKRRARIELNFMGKEVRFDVGINLLE
ncbi:antiterminator LoaP [Paenibacillus sp. chi10]|uniref:Antiterminator LoaP n=2 Tax=Paenibacillus TaxID=44249 RepID=A0AAJ2N4Z8_9BACL|nr:MULTISPECIES: antiterminator LoaP [unclassified Paenibacillus]MDT8977356.1 antiterminator LoaP [Paenibacillus sp. chi10]TQR46693.1 antiterminator LoaP [Paenibacillus sp. SDF0028]GAV11564.1 transcription antitermination protein NusG [Paenibacillus sp. NAIST15-1]